MQWTPELQQYAYDLFQNGMGYESVARMIEHVVQHPVTAEQVRMAVRRLRQKQHLPVRPSSPSVYSPPEIAIGHVLICSDLHVPHHSPEMIDRLHSVAQMYRINTLIVAGDLYNLDSLSPWPPIAPHIPTLDDELAAVGEVLLDLSGTFHTIHILTGNHELRLLRRLQTFASLQHLISASLEKARGASIRSTITSYPTTYMIVHSGHQRWMIGHFPTVSRRRGEVARMLAEKYRMNVAGGHDHVQGVASTSDGMFVGISIGCMIDIDLAGRSSLWYVESRLSTYPQMQQGFLRLDNGAPILYTTDGLAPISGGTPWRDIIPQNAAQNVAQNVERE